MESKHHILSQNFFMISARVLTLLTTFILTVLSSRILHNVASFGILMTISAYYVFLREISVMSVKTLIIREIIKKQKSSITSIFQIYIFTSLITIFGSLIISIVLKLLNYSSNVTLLSLIFNLSLLFEAIIQSNESKIESFKRFDLLFILHLIYSGIRILTFLIFTYKTPSLAKVIISFITASIIGSIIHTYLLFKNEEKIILSLDKEKLKKTFQVSSIFLLSSFFYGLMNSLDIMMLSKLSGPQDAGIYAPAARLNKFCFLYAFSVVSVFYPHLLSYLKKSQKDFINFSEQIFFIIIFTTIPIQFLFPIFAKYVIYFFFGNKYLPSIPILKILIYTQVPFSIYFFLSRYMLSLHKEKTILMIDFITLLLQFIILYISIKTLGLKGAPISIVGINIILAVSYLYFLNKQKIKFRISKSLFSIFIFLIPAAIIYEKIYTIDFKLKNDILLFTSIVIITLLFAVFYREKIKFIIKLK